MGHLTLRQRTKIPDYRNPNQITTGQLEFDHSKCIKCGRCYKPSPCPSQAIQMVKDMTNKKKNFPVLTGARPGLTYCMSCGDCVRACPQDAITIKNGLRTEYFYTRLTQAPEMTGPKKY